MYSFDNYPIPVGIFKADDGVEIPWFEYGNKFASETIFLLNGFTCNQFNIAKLVAGLATKYRVVTFDYRGQGLAYQLRHKEVSIDAVLRDIDALYRHIGKIPVILMGYSMGCQLAVEWNFRDNHNFKAIVLLFGIYGRIFDSFLNLPIFTPLFHAAHRVFPRLKGAYGALWKFLHTLPYNLRVTFGRGVLINPKLVTEEELRPFLDQLAYLDLEHLINMAYAIHHHSNEKEFHKILAPCLIISGEKDLFAIPAHSERVHANVKDSSYAMIAGGTHNAVLENSQEIIDRVQLFLNEHSFS